MQYSLDEYIKFAHEEVEYYCDGTPIPEVLKTRKPIRGYAAICALTFLDDSFRDYVLKSGYPMAYTFVLWCIREHLEIYDFKDYPEVLQMLRDKYHAIPRHFRVSHMFPSEEIMPAKSICTMLIQYPFRKQLMKEMGRPWNL